MSTLTEIKSAIAGLPPEEVRALAVWFERKLAADPGLSDEALCGLGDDLFLALDEEEALSKPKA